MNLTLHFDETYVYDNTRKGLDIT